MEKRISIRISALYDENKGIVSGTMTLSNINRRYDGRYAFTSNNVFAGEETDIVVRRKGRLFLRVKEPLGEGITDLPQTRQAIGTAFIEGLLSSIEKAVAERKRIVVRRVGRLIKETFKKKQ